MRQIKQESNVTHARQKIMKSRTAKKGEILYLDILSVCTQVKEKKVKMEQYGIVRSIRNGKSKHEKIQKESMVCFATVSEAKRAMTDIEHNCTMKDGVQKFTRVKKKQKYTESNTVRRETDNNSRGPPRPLDCENHRGIKLITRLRVGLSHLREWKLKYSFQDTLNPICSCDFDVAVSISHHILRCSMYNDERHTLLSTIKIIDCRLLDVAETVLIKTF